MAHRPSLAPTIPRVKTLGWPPLSLRDGSGPEDGLVCAGPPSPISESACQPSRRDKGMQPRISILGIGTAGTAHLR
jgi:hypothetical protein